MSTPQDSRRRPTPTNLLVTALGVRAGDDRAAALVTVLADRLHPHMVLELTAVELYATQIALSGRAVRERLTAELTVERYGDAARHG